MPRGSASAVQCSAMQCAKCFPAPCVFQALLRRLAEHQEVGWLDAICQELVNYGG